MRTFFNDAGYFEVETPILQSIPGGAAADLSLRITMLWIFLYI
jgi:lysyl-tRNA synthetase class II